MEIAAYEFTKALCFTPECRMVLGFDGVIAKGLEKVARNLEAVVGFLFAVCVGSASVAERAANPVKASKHNLFEIEDVTIPHGKSDQSSGQRLASGECR